MSKIKIILSIAIILPVLVYIVNPLGTATWDPRARIIGYVPYSITSKSMAPTIQVNDVILVSAAAYVFDEPVTNDLVVFKFPKDRSTDFIMRVVAIGGETFSIEQGQVIVNGNAVEQPYVDETNMVRTKKINLGPLQVPSEMLFVLGDNRDNSNDSRYWGFVPTEDVVGKVKMIIMSDDEKRIGKIE